jgi:exodeoxyribonuclease VII large subunit
MVRYFSYKNQSFYDRLEFVRKRLYSNLLTDKVRQNRVILEQNKDKTLKNLLIIRRQKHFDLQELSGKLHALSPISILERGYSITRTTTDKKIVKDADSVFMGQKLELILARGMLNCSVEGKKPHVEEDV